MTLLWLRTITLLGFAGALVFGWYAWSDWAALGAAYGQFERSATGSSEFSRLFIANAKQNIHRINLAAEGIWALLSTLIGAVGLHGQAILTTRSKNTP